MLLTSEIKYNSYKNIQFEKSLKLIKLKALLQNRLGKDKISFISTAGAEKKYIIGTKYHNSNSPIIITVDSTLKDEEIVNQVASGISLDENCTVDTYKTKLGVTNLRHMYKNKFDHYWSGNEGIYYGVRYGRLSQLGTSNNGNPLNISFNSIRNWGDEAWDDAIFAQNVSNTVSAFDNGTGNENAMYTTPFNAFFDITANRRGYIYPTESNATKVLNVFYGNLNNDIIADFAVVNNAGSYPIGSISDDNKNYVTGFKALLWHTRGGVAQYNLEYASTSVPKWMGTYNANNIVPTKRSGFPGAYSTAMGYPGKLIPGSVGVRFNLPSGCSIDDYKANIYIKPRLSLTPRFGTLWNGFQIPAKNGVWYRLVFFGTNSFGSYTGQKVLPNDSVIITEWNTRNVNYEN